MSSTNSILLCIDDPYRQTAEGVVQKSDSDERGPYVVLDSTLFYPQGGGQKGDRGFVEAIGLPVLSVVDTRKADGEVRQYVTFDAAVSIGDYAGRDVTQKVDWPYRYHQMKMHSTAHFLHGALEEVVGETLPYPVRAPLSEIGGECHYEFVDKFDAAGLVAATKIMNTYMAEGHEISTSPEESRGPGFRSWRCENLYILCGGLHPRNSAEIGEIKTSMRQKRGKSLVSFEPADVMDTERS